MPLTFAAKLLVDLVDADLPRNEKFVALTLGAFCKWEGDGGGLCYPAKGTVQLLAGFDSRPPVDAAFQGLIDRGVLVLVRAGGGGRRTNLYRLVPSKLTPLRLGLVNAPAPVGRSERIRDAALTAWEWFNERSTSAAGKIVLASWANAEAFCDDVDVRGVMSMSEPGTETIAAVLALVMNRQRDPS